jgi:hypothetical protein
MPTSRRGSEGLSQEQDAPSGKEGVSMISSDPQYNNAKALVARCGVLVAEARRVGANDAADELAAYVEAGEQALAQYPALAAEAERCQNAQREAYKAVEAASHGFQSGSVRHSELQDLRQAASIADARVAEARGACSTLLNKRIEKPSTAALAAFKRAEAIIRAIADCCLSGYGNEWTQADKEKEDAEARPWEPVVIAREIADYPNRQKGAPNPHPVEHFKEVLAWREGRRSRVAAPPPKETVHRKGARTHANPNPNGGRI